MRHWLSGLVWYQPHSLVINPPHTHTHVSPRIETFHQLTSDNLLTCDREKSPGVQSYTSDGVKIRKLLLSDSNFFCVEPSHHSELPSHCFFTFQLCSNKL